MKRGNADHAHIFYQYTLKRGQISCARILSVSFIISMISTLSHIFYDIRYYDNPLSDRQKNKERKKAFQYCNICQYCFVNYIKRNLFYSLFFFVYSFVSHSQYFICKINIFKIKNYTMYICNRGFFAAIINN